MDATAPIPAGAASVRWISPAWFPDHRDDDAPVPDCQPNIHEYVGGHIPGAVTLPRQGLINEKAPRKIRPLAGIRSAGGALGATSDRTFDCSCGAGHATKYEFPIFPPLRGSPGGRLPGGSVSEWIIRPGSPAATGPDP